MCEVPDAQDHACRTWQAAHARHRPRVGLPSACTRLNFSDNLGLGRTFGARGEQELSLRWQHTSNGGIRKPNPGQDLLLVRYAHAF